MEILTIDWDSLFAMETSILELILRGAILYFGILLLMRLLPRRAGGELETMDLIFVLLIAEGAAHSLGEYTSISEGLIVIVTLMTCNHLVNLLSFHFPAFERIVVAKSLPIIKDGKLIRKNMRREYLTMDELKEHLHEEGLEDISKIKIARVEGDGKISFILKSSKN